MEISWAKPEINADLPIIFKSYFYFPDFCFPNIILWCCYFAIQFIFLSLSFINLNLTGNCFARYMQINDDGSEEIWINGEYFVYKNNALIDAGIGQQ